MCLSRLTWTRVYVWTVKVQPVWQRNYENSPRLYELQGVLRCELLVHTSKETQSHYIQVKINPRPLLMNECLLLLLSTKRVCLNAHCYILKR